MSLRWWSLLLLAGLVAAVAGVQAQEQPRIVTGVVRSAPGAGAPLVIEAPGQTEQLNLRAANVVVTRDDQPATLVDLRPGDTVTLEIGPDNMVQRIDARSAAPGSATAGNVVVGTVDENTGGQVTVMTASGAREFTIPSGAYIGREGRETQVGAIQADDSVVVLLDPAGNLQSIFAQPAGNQYVVEGTTTGAIREHMLEVEAGEQILNVPLPLGEEARVTRNGRVVSLTDIEPGDRVTIHFNAMGQPAEVAARSPGRAGLLRNWWLLLLCLIPLALLLLFLRQQQPAQALFVLPRRRRRVANPDDIDGLRRG